MNEWISIKDKWPRLGQKVLLYSNGVVQNEIYYLNQGDEVGYFWDRDDLDNSPLVIEDDYWMPLPAPPKVL